MAKMLQTCGIFAAIFKFKWIISVDTVANFSFSDLITLDRIKFFQNIGCLHWDYQYLITTKN